MLFDVVSSAWDSSSVTTIPFQYNFVPIVLMICRNMFKFYLKSLVMVRKWNVVDMSKWVSKECKISNAY